jgi:hypothetical protein
MNKESKKINNNIVYRRNERLKQFFESKGINVSIIGSVDAPAVIINNEFCLSCYVSNFYLHFQNKPYEGQTIFSIKLTKEIDNSKDADLNYWLENAEHRKIYKVQAQIHNEDTTLYLSGFSKDENTGSLKPVFSEINPRIYFNYEKALDIITQYSNEDILLKII